MISASTVTTNNTDSIKLMKWEIPLDYTIHHNPLSLTPVEIKKREQMITSFIQDKDNGCDHNTQKLADLIFIQRNNIFLTGWGGTGKSYQMKLLFKLAKYIYREVLQSVVICSTTGSSALNLGIPEATTINSWSGILIEDRKYRKMVDKEYVWCENEGSNYLKNIGYKIKNTELLFIDEVSMLGGFYLKTLDIICKQVKKSSQPFGGIQIIFVGDMLQLPPVNDSYPFLYKVWKHLNLVYYVLNECHRQENQMWASLLGRVRVANVWKKEYKMFSSLDQLSIDTIKSRNFTDKNSVPNHCLWLYSRNADAKNHNQTCLDSIQNEELYTSVSIDITLVETRN